MGYLLVALLLLLDIPLFIWIGKRFFLSWEDFVENFTLSSQRMWKAIRQEELVEYVWSRARVLFFILLCGGLLLIEYILVQPVLERVVL